MNRKSALTKDLNRILLGVEVAPWAAPICPKRDGWNCFSLDILSRDQLIKLGKDDVGHDEETLKNIEDVDFVGNANEIEYLISENGLLGKLDYVISSHNIEHLTNPIKFLRGCSNILGSEGRLVMAIPDLRFCFDYFRQPTMLPEWLTAYKADQHSPTPTQTLYQNGFLCTHPGRGAAFDYADDANLHGITDDLADVYKAWEQESAMSDVHCSRFTPSSFSLLIHDLRYLGLIDFVIHRIEGPFGCEFHAHLQKSVDQLSHADWHQERLRLLHEIKNEIAKTSRWASEIYRKQYLLEDEANKHRVQMEAITKSRSWRLTRPLRAIKSIFSND